MLLFYDSYIFVLTAKDTSTPSQSFRQPFYPSRTSQTVNSPATYSPQLRVKLASLFHPNPAYAQASSSLIEIGPHLRAVTPILLEAARKRKQEEGKKEIDLVYTERDVTGSDDINDDIVHGGLGERTVEVDLSGKKGGKVEQSLVGTPISFMHCC